MCINRKVKGWGKVQKTCTYTCEQYYHNIRSWYDSIDYRKCPVLYKTSSPYKENHTSVVLLHITVNIPKVGRSQALLGVLVL